MLHGLMLASLAQDLARELRPVDEIRVRYRLESDELNDLLENDGFANMVREAHAAWHSDDGAETRVRAKAAAVVEDRLLLLHDHLGESAPATFNELFKTAMRLAGFETPVKGGTNSPSGDPTAQSLPRFTITINLGAERAPVTIDGTATAVATPTALSAIESSITDPADDAGINFEK